MTAIFGTTKNIDFIARAELTKEQKKAVKAEVKAGNVAEVKCGGFWFIVAKGHPLFPTPVTVTDDNQGLTAEEIEAGEIWAEECQAAFHGWS
jgi:hypothetical protein